MDEIREIKLSGDVGLVGGGVATTRKARRGRKQEGGTSPGTIVQLVATRAPGDGAAAAPTPAEPAPIISMAPAPAPAPLKVVLGGKRKTARVILEPKKQSIPAISEPRSSSKTRKVKRVQISLSSLDKKLTRARKIKSDSRHMRIDEIKRSLLKANLIKPTTTAPEKILRMIYQDYMMLKNRAL